MSAALTEGRTSRGSGRLVGTGVVVTVAAATATALAAAAASAAGVSFEVQGGEVVPVSGIAVVTAACSLVGVVLAAALRRWSARPATRFLQVTVALTALSMLPPLAWGDRVATAATLCGLHLLAAAVVVPPLLRRLSPR